MDSFDRHANSQQCMWFRDSRKDDDVDVLAVLDSICHCKDQKLKMALQSRTEDEPEESWNVIVMSAAGKPIFWRSGTNEQINTTCGIIQALRSSASASGLEDIQSLRLKTLSVVFVNIGAITLVAISKQENKMEEFQLLRRLQLEYVYGRILFALTQQIQDILTLNPNYDLSEALAPAESAIQQMLHDQGVDCHIGPYLMGAIDTFGPIPSNIRGSVSMALLNVMKNTPNTVFAIMLVKNKLLSLVQPSHFPHQLLQSDLRLLIKFVDSQPGLLVRELWLPMCLPRFNSKGFLYAYSSCLHEKTKLSLVLLSQLNTTEQFQLFRHASKEVRRDLGLPMVIGSVLQILHDNDSEKNFGDSVSKDVAWKRVNDSLNLTDNSPVSLAITSSDSDGLDKTGSNTVQQEEVVDHADRYSSILRQIHAASSPESRAVRIEGYLKESQALHFLFRRDFEVRGHVTNECGILPQCFSLPLPNSFPHEYSKRRVWSIYQKLCLRLRNASAPPDAALTEHNHTVDPVENHESPSMLSNSTTMMNLTEYMADTNCVSYIIDGTELFFAMKEHDFELYAIFPASLSMKVVTANWTKLVGSLMKDSSSLFLMEPLTWKG